MLIFASENSATTIRGEAHIVISIAQDGTASMASFIGDRWDSIHMRMPDDALVQTAACALLQELRRRVQSEPPEGPADDLEGRIMQRLSAGLAEAIQRSEESMLKRLRASAV